MVIHRLQESLWRQFGASIDSLHDAIALCPEDYMMSNRRFFYMAYHTLVMLDYYLTIPPKDFAPALPFTFKEIAEMPEGSLNDMLPDRFYTKTELLEYLALSRYRCKTLIESLTEEKLTERFTEDFDADDIMDYPILEILLYNMRHVQHHAAQLNMLLRQGLDQSPKWVFRANEDS